MSSEADNDKRQMSKSRWVQSKWVLAAMVIIYIMVLATTLSIHKKHKRYFSQHNFSTGIDVQATQEGVVGEKNDGKLDNDAALSVAVDLTDGQHVTDILQNKTQNNEQTGMRFLPGTLRLSQAETLSHCYADPKIYEHHFTKRKQRGIPISLKHKLVFAMIAKSGSSTGRWVMNNVLEAEELRVNKDLLELSPGGKYEDFDVIAFVRDPLSRFYSSYDETYFRYGPWMTQVHKDKGGYASWAKHVNHRSRGPGAAGGRKRPTTATIRRPGENGPGGRSHPGSKSKGALDADSVKRAVEAASDPSLSFSHAVRHGCTKDVREMYLETMELIPTSEVDLHKALIENKLIEPGEKMSRPRMKRKTNLDNDGKPKKRRYYERKNMRRTNVHLDGTDIGAMLAAAAERQSQGKAVGDGGM